MIRRLVVQYCQSYHGLIHFLFGLLAIVLVPPQVIKDTSFVVLVAVAVVGAFFPDLDHLLFYFTYGRHTHYATKARTLLLRGQWQQYLDFVLTNHKSNHFILSHNLATPVICYGISTISTSPLWQVFFLSCTLHFYFDIAEDFLALGRLNPNWYFRFSSKNL
jgi:hypothetical protein